MSQVRPQQARFALTAGQLSVVVTTRYGNGKVNGVQQLATSLTAAETQQLTGHMGSRSVTCHPAEVTFSGNATHRATAGLESGLVSRRLRLSESDATGPNKTRMRVVAAPPPSAEVRTCQS